MSHFLPTLTPFYLFLFFLFTLVNNTIYKPSQSKDLPYELEKVIVKIQMTRYLNFILNSVCNKEIAECNYSRNLIENIFFILFSLVFGMIKKTIIEKFIRICMYITEINLHYKPEFALQHYLPSEFTKISSRCSLINRVPDFAVAIHIICIHRFTLHSTAS